MAFLTDRTLATGVTLNDLIHIVITGDTSQNPAGSSYKASIGQVLSNVIFPTDYWTSGSTGVDSIKAVNPTGLDATGDRAVAWGNQTLASGNNSTASGDGSIASGLTSHAEGFQTVAGDYSHTEGYQTQASDYSHAEGVLTIALQGSHAEGDTSYALGIISHAEGANTIAQGNYSHAEGIQTNATGFASHAEGSSTTTSGASSHAEGSSTTTSGDSAHAEGYSTIAGGDFSHAEGESTSAFGLRSHTEGYNTIANCATSHAEGVSTTSIGVASHSQGDSTIASGDTSHAEGYQSIAGGFASHAEGGYFNGFFYFSGGSATGIGSHAEGAGTIATGDNSHAEGQLTTATGIASHAEGLSTIAQGDYSHAEGFFTQALGDYTHTEGDSTIASTLRSHAEGYYSLAANQGAHAEGGYYDGFNIISGGTAAGLGSHAEGGLTIANGITSHAEGYQTTASGNYSHSEGYQTTASGDYSHSEGQQTSATTTWAHAEGITTLASGGASHAEGYATIANGSFSHTEGYFTIASGNASHAGGYQSIANGSRSFIHSSDSLVSGNRSVVIGGQNITGTTDDTVYVPYLNISLLGTGTSINNLGIDVNGFVVTGTTGGFSGGIVTGTTTFTGGLSATTISATTIGSPTDCVDDLYVYNIHSCSPLNINPLDEGNVYFGSNSGITVDLANERLGVGTDSPQYPLQVVGTNSEFYYDPTSTGGRFNIFSSTGIPRFDVTIAFNSFVQPATGGSVGMRSWTDTIFPGYGGNGDMFLYAGANTRNLNIINAPSGSVPLDNIRFYAGTTPDLSTAHMFIDGNGSSKGFIGLGLETPSEKLHVSGNTRITGNVRIGGPNNTYSSLIPGLSVGPNNELGIYSETASIENNIQLRTGSAGSNIRLYNGTTSPSLNTRLTQYSNYSALEANFSTGSTNATLFIVNESDGPIIFRTSGTDDTLYLLPSGDTTSVFSGTNEPVVYVVNYLEAENIALRSVGTSAFVNDIRIDATGKLTTNTSDERLKENIKPITGGLDTILQLSGVTYQWKDRKAGGNDERFGFIAQQVESVEPRLSFTNKVDQYKGVHTDAMIPLLVEAIKEQQVVIDELKNRISALENLNN